MFDFDVLIQYLKLGYTHVIPLGFDHILFIGCIYFYNSNLRSILIQCSIFTLAHSLTLGLSTVGFLVSDTRLIEPLIAISILIAAIENIIQSKKISYRYGIIFIFGLIHGLGFASSLLDIGIPKTNFILSLLSFNLGVEFGQISVIIFLFLLIGKWFSQKPWYTQRIVFPISSIIGSIAVYWTIQRIFYN